MDGNRHQHSGICASPTDFRLTVVHRLQIRVRSDDCRDIIGTARVADVSGADRCRRIVADRAGSSRRYRVMADIGGAGQWTSLDVFDDSCVGEYPAEGVLLAVVSERMLGSPAAVRLLGGTSSGAVAYREPFVLFR